MSAPIRPMDESTKTAQNKQQRRPPIRRRRIARTNDEYIAPSEPKYLETSDENEPAYENKNDKYKGAQKKAISTRSRSVLSSCDVVTLVSLLSSGGSDSEHEDASYNKPDVTSVRAPMLKKTGKSGKTNKSPMSLTLNYNTILLMLYTVSFQENEDLQNIAATSTREFPAMLRRGSIAPLAARIRANRPPSAPPVSIYLRENLDG